MSALAALTCNQVRVMIFKRQNDKRGTQSEKWRKAKQNISAKGVTGLQEKLYQFSGRRRKKGRASARALRGGCFFNCYT